MRSVPTYPNTKRTGRASAQYRGYLDLLEVLDDGDEALGDPALVEERLLLHLRGPWMKTGASPRGRFPLTQLLRRRPGDPPARGGGSGGLSSPPPSPSPSPLGWCSPAASGGGKEQRGRSAVVRADANHD
jgi:hypothetical protein